MNFLAHNKAIGTYGERRRDAGFSLIELITVTSIVAILLAIGVPSFRYVTSANRASSEINGLLGDLQFARSEAIREGQTVTVCVSTDGSTCATGAAASTSWQSGWLVFSDLGTTGTFDAGTDSLLKVQKPFSGQDTLGADNSIKAITFSREGFALGLPGAIVLTLHDSSGTAAFTRCLSVTLVGALSTQTNGVTTAENASCT